MTTFNYDSKLSREQTSGGYSQPLEADTMEKNGGINGGQGKLTPTEAADWAEMALGAKLLGK